MEAAVPELKYCLYARKSSESDERQAVSIDLRLAEMRSLAENEGLNVVCEKQESHSAKDSGKRPVYNEMLTGIAAGEYNAVLTWAPDRLSRSAGGLGAIVDLMDQHKLLHIRTYSQTFTNSPNEKFLLMILCSQAKPENDNKSINVKRGIRTKCEMGWRPGVAPLGYINRSFGKEKYLNETDFCVLLQEFIEANHKKIHISDKLRAKVKKHYGVTKTLFEHYKIKSKRSLRIHSLNTLDMFSLTALRMKGWCFMQVSVGLQSG